MLTGPTLHLQRISRKEAARIEAALAEALADAGIKVEGGHVTAPSSAARAAAPSLSSTLAPLLCRPTLGGILGDPDRTHEARQPVGRSGVRNGKTGAPP